ncbi:MAG: hypothetical protein AABM29_07495, partial [Actinomycetota bacterium]
AALLGSGRLRALPRPALLGAAAALIALALGAGWLEQRRYLDHRYRDPSFATPGLNAAFAWARDLSGERIGTNATREYPLFGTELANQVEFVGVHRSHGGFVRAASCAQWRGAVNDGGYDYVVASLDRIQPAGPAFPREAAWTRDRNAEVVLRQAPTVVFRLRGRLPPSRC